MAKKKFYSIKYPFTAEDKYKFYVDLNITKYDSIRSDITHLLFTPSGTRLRDPQFGSNLIRKLFQPMDEITYGDIKGEIQNVVKRYIPSVTFTELITTPTEDGRGVTVTMNYTVDEGAFLVNDSLTVDL